MAQQVLTTTVVGSYPQPDWLVDRAMLSKGVPRVRQRGIWRVPEDLLEQAQDDATIVAIRDMERAGIDIISDGEIRRESYSNRFATALDGVDVDQPAVITDRYGNQTQVPRVVGPIRRIRPIELRDMQFLRRNTDRLAKMTLPGPFTMAQQARNEHYRDLEELAMDYATTCRPRAPTSSSSTSPGCATIPRRPSATRCPRSIARSPASPCRPRSTSASATRRW
jgi:5-methyltetrahydropteroyltriglutamate--homocysteine methyltransferase